MSLWPTIPTTSGPRTYTARQQALFPSALMGWLCYFLRESREMLFQIVSRLKLNWKISKFRINFIALFYVKIFCF